MRRVPVGAGAEAASARTSIRPIVTRIVGATEGAAQVGRSAPVCILNHRRSRTRHFISRPAGKDPVLIARLPQDRIR